MKRVITILAVAAAMLATGNANAQLSVNAGFANQSKAFTGTVPILGTSTSRDTNMAGFFVGASYNINLTGDLGVAPGIYYQNLSHGTEATALGVTARTKDVEQAITIPVLFNYGFELNNNFKLFVFAGPSLTYGLTKTFKFWLTGDEPTDPTFDYYEGDTPTNNRINVFGTVGAGLQYHQLRLQAGYNMGFLDRTTNDNTTEKVNNLFVGLGYAL